MAGRTTDGEAALGMERGAAGSGFFGKNITNCYFVEYKLVNRREKQRIITKLTNFSSKWLSDFIKGIQKNRYITIRHETIL